MRSARRSTGLRKGADGGGSMAAWEAIYDMDREQWKSAVSYAVYGLTHVVR